MASGLSRRYGKNKLLEKLDGKEIILHSAGHLQQAGLSPLVVTRSDEVKALLDMHQIRCVYHEMPLKSDAIHIGLENTGKAPAGYLFMPADQPLTLPETIRRLVSAFLRSRERAVRLGFDHPGSPVLFPAALRSELLAYQGDRGGIEVLRRNRVPCEIVRASYEWELWDVDTPEKMDRVRRIAQAYGDVFPERRNEDGKTD